MPAGKEFYQRPFFSQGKETKADPPATEKTTLIRWLADQDSDVWDQRMEADFSEGGAGVPLLARCDSEIKSGGSILLAGFLEQRGAKSHTLTSPLFRYT
jgi:hypothetical protein